MLGMNFSNLEGWKDYVMVAVGLFLVYSIYAGITGTSIPALATISAVVFIIGGAIGTFNGLYGEEILQKIIDVVAFLVVLLVGLSQFVALPVVGGYIALVPISAGSYIVHAVLLVAVIYNIFSTSNYM